MEDMATGFALWPTPEHPLAMFGGDEFRNVMMDAAMDKAKDVVERGKQLIQESEPTNKPAE